MSIVTKMKNLMLKITKNATIASEDLHSPKYVVNNSSIANLIAQGIIKIDKKGGTISNNNADGEQIKSDKSVMEHKMTQNES